MRAFAGGLAALGVGQEPVGAVQRHEGPGHRGHARRDAAAMQVADAVRRAGPPDRVVQQARRRRATATRTSPGLAAARMRVVTAAGQPRPRSKLRGLEQRQADHVGIAAGQEAHERRGAALDRIAAGLAVPLAAARDRRRSAPRSGGRRRRRCRPGARPGARPARSAPPPSARGGGGRTAAPGRRRASASVSALGRMRRPPATTVSAASTKPPGAAAASALARARRTRIGARQLVARGAFRRCRGQRRVRDDRRSAPADRSRRGLADASTSRAVVRLGYLKRNVMRPLDRS